ncbi:RhuM family protein [Sodalis ligni]|uniref:Virulence RhuM family protein n=1 Tax=Sodalis ligni TaxID=2697027 RepID=A0A4R1NIG8_9GAMM|nr:RhuM family protein [Sodalis ligni]TCL06859.1 hypothetical protein EZJ58_5156 [Sodalis ligni]
MAGDENDESNGPLSIVQYNQDNQIIDFKYHQESEEIWATTKEIASLYGVERQTIIEHISNIYKDGELEQISTCREFRLVQNEGKRSVSRTISHFNMDIVISVGFRVNAKKAIAFRQWGNKTLRAYLEQGYLINETLLRESPEKLNELAAQVRALRAGEKQVYEKVRECFKISASDYDPKAQEVRSFYALLQDKFHHAITGLTSSKLIQDRADHTADNMGLYSMKGTFPTMSEIIIGKNYLKPDEIYKLHLLSEQFLLYAESAALRGKNMTMQSLHKQLDRLLTLNDYDVLPGYTDYIKDEAIEHARQEYALYKKRQIVERNGITYDDELMAAGEYNYLFED